MSRQNGLHERLSAGAQSAAQLLGPALVVVEDAYALKRVSDRLVKRKRLGAWKGDAGAPQTVVQPEGAALYCGENRSLIGPLKDVTPRE